MGTQKAPTNAAKPTHKAFDRRSFLKGAIFSAAAFSPMMALTGCSNPSESHIAEAAELKPEPGNEMTLEELNRFRAELVEKQTEYVCSDGTVIPAVYVKLRALMNTYSFGFGSEVHDHAFDEFIYLFDEDEAQAYLEMPYGVEFSATDFAIKSGRNEDECLALCEDLASRALLRRIRRGGVSYFHHLAMAYGMWEYRVCGDDSMDYVDAHKVVWGDDVAANKMGSYTPFYYTVPVHHDVVVDDEIYAYDDYKKIIERNTVFGIAPCQCQKIFTATGDIPPSDVLLDRCIVLGVNAEYCIENGFARAATKEEILELIQYCVDEGMVVEKVWTKEPEVLCMCHKNICGILAAYQALGDDFTKFNTFGRISHYQISLDKEKCDQCGACVDRCPVFAISINDEGYPSTKASCVSCGQCGYACPQDARVLSMKTLEGFPDLSENLLDDYNVKAMYRATHNMI